MRKVLFVILILCVGVILLFGLNLYVGAVDIPFKVVLEILGRQDTTDSSWTFIVLETRFPQAVTALFCGSILAVNGLMLQTLFSNPLAGPDVFGINSGAALGVALVMLFFGENISAMGVSLSGFLAVLLAAFVGAIIVTLVILFLSNFVKSNTVLLIVGVMVGYVSSSIVSLLNFYSTAEGVKSYMVWGMGDFGGVVSDRLSLFVVVSLIGLLLSLLMIKRLNILSLGNQYAAGLGLNIKASRLMLLGLTGVLTAVTTAFCGPVMFLGLAVPHIARLLIRTENQLKLLPVTMLSGSFMALLCNLLCNLSPNGEVLPLNVVTPMIGAPVIIYILVRKTV